MSVIKWLSNQRKRWNKNNNTLDRQIRKLQNTFLLNTLSIYKDPEILRFQVQIRRQGFDHLVRNLVQHSKNFPLLPWAAALKMFWALTSSNHNYAMLLLTLHQGCSTSWQQIVDRNFYTMSYTNLLPPIPLQYLCTLIAEFRELGNISSPEKTRLWAQLLNVLFTSFIDEIGRWIKPSEVLYRDGEHGMKS